MIDLRSDTVTQPTETMLEAMRRAELGDDSRDGDPTVQRLEEMSAHAVGKESALFVASGTMANLVALLAHTGRGGEVLLDADCHIVRTEMGGLAQLAGLFHRIVPAERGALDIESVRQLIQPKLLSNRLATALVCVETSHNDAGGAVVPLASLSVLRVLTAEYGIPIHIDGARLFNAAVALNVPPAEIAKRSDSVGFCISKGLSAPVGSVLCGSQAFIDKARAYRRMVGGAMRQAGVLAAAGIVGLNEMIARLADDHTRARRIARDLHALDARLVNPKLVETNIVRVDVSHTGKDAKVWALKLNECGVRAGIWNSQSLRLVTHRHIDDVAVDQTIAAFRKAQLTAH
ncbi:MAG TPA: GntG family PLP-dependent aldolase [Xanthobacteraceae bacterium]|jgi:threonine aldolase|nr:GntG family PLP-dependent aldolase [Xanthobacteraceae bacterium]